MQRHTSDDFENIYSHSFRYLTSSTPILYEEDPWSTTYQEEIGFPFELSNVLLGVDVPDAYTDIYSQCNPHHQTVNIKALEIILKTAGLSHQAQKEVMHFISPEISYVTRNEFNAYLALIACAQKKMDISLETVYHHKEDLPIPILPDLTHLTLQPNAIKQDDQHTQLYQEEQKALNQWLQDLDHISLTLTLEKEGFLFKHINYQIKSEKLGTSVLRRFSDFWWLWETLLKRYPCRIIPHLPPKKLGGRTDVFEDRRRKGLSRFMNAVIQHPVLGKDEVVKAFLSHPSEMTTWRRKHPPSLDEEFVRTSYSMARLEQLIPLDLDDRIIRMRKRLTVSVQLYERMCLIMNQMNRLNKALGSDYARYSMTLNFVSDLDKDCWVPNCEGCQQMVHGYEGISKSLQQTGAMLHKHAIITDNTIVESLKQQRDLLDAFKELLERKERLNTMSNQTLSRLIAKYQTGKIQPTVAHDVQQVQEHTLPEHIRDQDTGLTLTQQRDIFIRYCLMSELSFLHKQQTNISMMYNTFVTNQLKHTKQWTEHWKNIALFTTEMPKASHVFL
ncbi:uncharacterized protein B0P05DRAFT_559881 [Gilbertella persicaria]|uniref:uncharacterized protein n=1 Tax=Gilbertella persicaria TaxID=101096 RepID=UPI0022201841|nr:uncharacterized protein B0P05DRAFT_559881 [Gilbertella persicaria]KAI8057590.1 hypothetical protein B0P05DRAFT_559881 [Gilbertella persicaria]